MSEVAYLTKLLGEDAEYEYFATSIVSPSARLKIGEASLGDAVLWIGGDDWVRIEDDE